MDNRKDARTGSGWLREPEVGSGGKQKFGKLAGSQEPPGFEATGPTSAPVQV